MNKTNNPRIKLLSHLLDLVEEATTTVESPYWLALTISYDINDNHKNDQIMTDFKYKTVFLFILN